MKRWTSIAVAAVVLLAALVAFGGPSARAEECKTQGNLAIALAQLLSLAGEGVTPEDAAAALSAVGIQPLDGWNLGACLDQRTVAEVDRSLAAAITAHKLDQQYAGTVQSALATLGVPGLAPAGGAAPAVGVSFTSGRTYNPVVSPHQPR